MIPALTIAALTLPLAAPITLPLGEEAFGAEPVPANEEWAGGVLRLANDEHRVYRRWVNGNEEFFFRGDAAAVNQALAAFAEVDCDVAEVVLMPDAGGTRSFEGKGVAYDWRLFAPSGILLAMAKEDGGSGLYPTHATLTVHVDGEGLALDDLELPANVTLLGPRDLLERYVAALGAKEEFRRATAVGCLREVSFLPEAIEVLRRALDDEAKVVRTTAANVLQGVGARGRGALPRLYALLNAAQDHEERIEYELAIALISLVDPPDLVVEHALEQRAKALRGLLDGRRVELELERGVDSEGRPRFTATLENTGTLPVLAVQPGDGSDVGWRTPRTRWEVRDDATGELVEAPRRGRCGNLNAIRLEEMVTLAPGEKCALNQWFGQPYLPPAGTYRVVLHYDNDPTMEFEGLSGSHTADAQRQLRRSTPLSVTSAPVLVSME